MITIEQIDEFRKRTNSSYEDARYFLEKNNGDILDAIIDFERTKSGRQNKYKKQQDDIGKNLADILQKGFDTKIVVEDSNSTLFSVPVILLFLLIPLWVPVIILVIFLSILGYRFRIRDMKSTEVNVSNIIRNINEKMKETGGGKNTQKAQHGHGGSGAAGKSGPPVKSGENYVMPTGNGTNPPEKPGPDSDDDEGYKEYTIE